jgi:large repetitive protein
MSFAATSRGAACGRRALILSAAALIAAVAALMGGIGGATAASMALCTTSVSAPTATPPSVNAGAPITYTATVTASSGCLNGTPTGSVAFFSNYVLNGQPASFQIGSAVQLQATSTPGKALATLVDNSLPAGTFMITASYTSNAQALFFDSGPSGGTSVVIGSSAPNTTTMSFTESASTITVGQSVEFRVHVTPVDGNGNPTGGVATGIVDFSAGPTASSGQNHFWSQQLDGTGSIDFSYNGFVAGDIVVMASYPGDPTDYGVSGQLPLHVLPAAGSTPTSTTVSASPSSINAGDSTTLTAHVVEQGGSPAPAGGQVDFFAGPSATNVTFEGSGTLDANGTAQLTVGNFTAGSYVVRAEYDGDTANNVAGSFGDNTLLVGTSGAGNAVIGTQLAYTGPTEAAFGTTVTLSGRLQQSGGAALAGEPLTLTLGSQSCTTGLTDGNGNASCTITIAQPGGQYPVSANFAGDANWGPSVGSATFTVDQASTTTSLVYNGATSAVTGASTTLSATLTDANGNPIAGKSIHLAMGSQSCDAGTDSTGKASCTITITQPTGTYPITASFAGDASYAASSAAGTFTVTSAGIATTTTYTGATQGKHGTQATLSATVTGAPNGEPVTFTLGSQTCTGTLSSGKASCTVTLSDPAGGYTVKAAYGGDATYTGSSASAPFTIASGLATVQVGSLGPVLLGSSVTLKGTLLDGSAPLSGRTLTLSLGSKSCTGTTGATGVASCTVTESDPSGTVTVKASFAGDSTYSGASATGSTIVYAYAPNGGSFVIGDKSTSGTVTFWGSQWSKANQLSGSAAPSSFKGFALNPSVPMCSAGWSTDPGNSSPPPAGPLPAYMVVVVTSAASKSGSLIYGNSVSLVIVQTNPGYSNDPGHTGTGTVVATLCSGGSASLPKLPSTLTYTGPTQGQTGSPTTLTAKLTSTASGVGLPNATVTLTLGSQSCTDQTDSSGNASCTITINQSAGTYPLSATFAGDSQNGASSASSSFTVTNVQHGGKGSSCKGTFNSSNIGGGNTLWFNSSLHVTGLPWNGATITFTGQTIVVGGQTISVPDSKVIFSRNVTTATTTFTNGQWVTTVPIGVNGNVFLSGLGYQLPSGLNGGQNATWSGTFTSDSPGVNINWQWGAAAYSGFGSNNNLNVKPVDDSNWGWGDSNHAGTPENWSSHVTGGGSGWGGSNYAGSYSNPCSLNF